MKILITGGAGFIGSHLTDKLLTLGDQVLVIDNYATTRRDNLKPHENLKVVEGTIADKQLVNQLFADFQPEFVIHAAASYKNPQDWEEDVRTNALGSAIITQASLKVNIKRLIYLQTALCYGLKPLEQPITLDHPLRPESSYAISKTAGEQYIALSGLGFISFRLANVYGPRNLSGPLPTFYHRLTNNKKCFVLDTRRDFIYIDDFIEVIMKALNGRGEKGYYHISSGSDYSIKELFDATVKALDIALDEEVEVRPRNVDDVYTILIDASKTNKDFNWSTHTPLNEGVKRTIDWYKVHGVTQTYTHLKIADEDKND